MLTGTKTMFVAGCFWSDKNQRRVWINKDGWFKQQNYHYELFV